MISFLRVVAISILVVTVSACGRAHSKVVTRPDNILVIEQITLLPVDVSSEEQNPDALALNAQWKTMAADELQAMLVAKNIEATSNSPTLVQCRIELVYGSRALRYFVGFGAGSGHMRVSIELKGSDGAVSYATISEADLAAGAWGGSMDAVAKKTIKAAVKEFGSRLLIASRSR